MGRDRFELLTYGLRVPGYSGLACDNKAFVISKIRQYINGLNSLRQPAAFPRFALSYLNNPQFAGAYWEPI